jgi:hypothetical protein
MALPETPISAEGFSVLEDTTGKRATWMRRAGRVVFIVFLAWLLAIVLGGLGLVPVDGIPFTQALRPSRGPAPIAKLPEPRQPSASDLRPARPAGVAVATGTAAHGAQSNPVQHRGQSATAPGRTKTTTLVRSSPGRRATAPGQTKTTTTAASSRGRSSPAPGRTKTTTPTGHGRNTTTPGHTRTTTTPGVSHRPSSRKP